MKTASGFFYEYLVKGKSECSGNCNLQGDLVNGVRTCLDCTNYGVLNTINQ